MRIYVLYEYSQNKSSMFLEGYIFISMFEYTSEMDILNKMKNPNSESVVCVFFVSCFSDSSSIVSTHVRHLYMTHFRT